MKALKYTLLTVIIVVCFGFIFLGTSPVNYHSKLSGTEPQNSSVSGVEPAKPAGDPVMVVGKSENGTTGGRSYTEYLSENMITGIIGTINGSDNPSDNIFVVDLDKVLNSNKSVWLEYDLFGVEDYNSITRSINDNLATGGCVVKKSEKWTKQREAIKPEFLKTGKNVIRFTAPVDKNYLYMVKNVSLRVEDSPAAGDRRLVVNQPTTAYYYKTFGYLQGFVEGSGSDDAVVTINSRKSRIINGVFEDVVSKPDYTNESWSVVVEAKFADGQVLQTTVHFDKPIEWDIYNGFDKTLYQAESFVKAYTPFEVKLQGASIQSDSCAIGVDANISITALRDIDFPPLEAGMINVTGGHSGYRFLPHGTHFERNIQIEIPYDECKIPGGYTAQDIVTYYFDEAKRHWIALPKVSVNLQSQVIISQTNHFTEFINTIIKVPESPQTQANVPTSIKDIKAANPLEGMDVIAPPKANNMGTANMSYPINLPQGRHGLQPSLAIQYSSGGGNGWLGLGWDISIPAVTVETRWGVPHYDPINESETYVLNGDQLSTHDMNENLEPLTFRSTWKLRNVSPATTKLFYPRIEGAFNKTIRHGNTPQTYWWEVIDRNGTISYYGKAFGSDNVDPLKVLKDTTGNIAYWALSEVKDTYGNWVRYTYDIAYDAGVVGSTYKGKQIYLRSINYTGHGSEQGKYFVYFNRMPKTAYAMRKDVTISARYGFKEVTADKLKSINIVYNDPNATDDTIRKYYFAYKGGEFNKTLLCGFAEADPHEFLSEHDVVILSSENCLYFASISIAKIHLFDYYDDLYNDQQVYEPYKAGVNINAHNDGVVGNQWFQKDPTALGASQSKDHSVGGALTVGMGLGVNPTNKNMTLGGNYHYSVSKSEGKITLIDIDGDGLPDKIVKNGSSLFYRKQILNTTGINTFSDPIPIRGKNNFLHEETRTNSWGGELLFEQYGAGVSASCSKSNTHSTTDVYFADVNGDGIPDIVDNGVAYFNNPDPATGGRIFQAADQDKVYMGDGSCGYSIYTGTVDDSVMYYNHDPKFPDPRIEEPRKLFDAVRVWVAPYDGNITIHSTIKLLENTSEKRKNSHSADGVRYRIQHKNYSDLIIDSIGGSIYTPRTCDRYTNVLKGDKIYFRLQSRKNIAFDSVEWAPTISYDGKSGVDADEKNIYSFNVEEDFLVSAKQQYYAPVDGSIRITGNIVIPKTSDAVVVKIIKNGTFNVYNNTFAAGSAQTASVSCLTSVLVGDSLEFFIESSTNVKWEEIKFSPHLYYEALPSTYGAVTNPDNSYKFEHYPIFSYKTYQNPVRPSVPVPLTPCTSMAVTPAITLNNNSLNGTITFAVKSSNELIVKQTLTVTTGVLSTPATNSFSIASNKTFYFEYYTTNPSLADVVASCKAHLVCNGTALTPDADAGLHTIYNNLSRFGNMYRGWGQFIYNNVTDEDYSNIIDETKLTVPTAIPTVPTFTPSADTSYDVIMGKIPNDCNPMLNKFIAMTPDNQKSRYSGFGDRNFIDNHIQSNVQLMDDNVVYDDSLVVQIIGNPNVLAVRKLNSSEGTSFSVSANAVVSLSASSTTGHSQLVLDYMDLNGDRYPDVVGQFYVQYSNPQGGLSTYVVDHAVGLVPSNKGENYAKGATLGTSYMGVTKLPGNNPKATKSTASTNGSTSATIGSSSDYTDYTWMDMNGDGLPDKVTNDGHVSLNLGYKFLPWESWGNLDVRSGESSNAGLSLGGSFSLWNFSFSGGLGLTTSNNNVRKLLQDYNGDGLPDKILITSSGLTVYLNTGAGFSASPLNIASNGVNYGVSSGESHSESINGSVTFGMSFPIPPTPFAIKFCINPQYSTSHSFNTENLQLSDMNDDGYPDIVSSTTPQYLNVSYSTIGKTNLLKEVRNSFGGLTNIHYSLSPCTQQCSQRTWLMDSVSVFDGFAGDGDDYQFSTFSYENGYYSRYERQFFGFESVTTNQIQPGQPENSRSITEEYHNDTYVFKGIKKHDILRDGLGNMFTEGIYTYVLKDILSGAVIGNPYCFGDGFPAIDSEEKVFWEGGGYIQPLRTLKRFSHGTYGNVITYNDDGNEEFTDDDIQTEVTYLAYNATTNISSAVISATTTHNNNILRYREADINSATGAVTEIRLYNGANASKYNMTYDNYGNLNSIEYPENDDNQRVNYTYTYDPVVYTYVTNVVDHFGYSSQSTYNYKWGRLTSATDIAGQNTIYQYDDRGRVQTIQGPYEILSNQPYTIKFEYWDYSGKMMNSGRTDNVLWARTFHYDPEYPTNDIETVLFCDAQGKVLQTKKDASISDGTSTPIEMMVVSGKNSYDGFGRILNSYFPITEALGSYKYYNYSPPELQLSKTYDILDRDLTSVLVDGSISSSTYTLGMDEFNKKSFLTTATDPNFLVTNIFTNAQGQKTTIIAPLNTVTKFGYNPLGELMYSIDPEGIQTDYSYDTLGRMQWKHSPDAGLTRYTYDKAGNIVNLQTQNLYDISAKINYLYDYNHLINVVYPMNPANTVSYQYGDPNSGNNTGRLIKQIDASGAQEFSYGPLGEVIQNRHTFIEPYGTNYTFETHSTYDTWNRIKSISYPDGEVVTYGYNNGGLLTSMIGVKGNTTTQYITGIKYDKFESRLTVSMGNGTTTRYTYETERRRLQHLTTTAINNIRLIDNDYQYDRTNNILSIASSAQRYNNIGGQANYEYVYDELYRLTDAGGQFSGDVSEDYQLSMTYKPSGTILQKDQSHYKDGILQNKTSYAFTNVFNSLPHAPSSNSNNDIFEYDHNGNMTFGSDLLIGVKRQMVWDEDNRMKLTLVNGQDLSYFLYDGGGERYIKINAQLSTMNLNGGYYWNQFYSDRQTLYVNPFMVCTVDGYTKHYYADNQRIATKIGGGFSTTDCPVNATYVYGINAPVPYSTKEYMEEQMIANDLYNLQTNLALELTHTLLENPDNNGTIGTQVDENEVYYYHSDHLGSSSFITDINGYPTQHLEYFPFGETFAEENVGSYGTPYKFNAKELDEETGLYYYGARYMDPRGSTFYGVDPMADKYPSTSPFAYCMNNPVKLIDPNGEDVEETDNTAKQVIAKFTQEYNTDGSLNSNYQKGFADIYNKFKDDHSILVRFSTDMSGEDSKTGGTISYNGTDDKNRSVFNVKWDEKLTDKLGTSGVFEESFHLKDGLDGNFNIRNGSCNGFSLDNEIKAKEWVVSNIKGIESRYSNSATGVNEQTHYGYFKDNLVSKNKLRDGLVNGIQTYGVGANSTRVKYKVFGFGGYSK